MGTILSRQEQLFLHQRWPELLEEAMTADMATLVTSEIDGQGDGGGDGGTQSSTRNATPQKTQASRAKKGSFRLSFQEWQALLSALEMKGDKSNSTPSDLCAALSPAQLHVPAVTLTVHLCVWWKGGISASVLSERIEHLVELVADGRHRRKHDRKRGNSSSSSSTETGTGDHGFTDVEEEPRGIPSSRRARLACYVKQRIIDRAKRRSSTAAAPAATDDNEELLLDTFADLVVLAQELLNQEGLLPADPTSVVGLCTTQGMRIFELYDEKIRDAEALKQRPVLAVVMVLVLAVYASRIQAHPQFATRSVEHLEALGKMMALGGKSGLGDSASTVAPRHSTSSTLEAVWPLTGELEVALVHRQHEAEAARCSSSEGEELRTTLQRMRENRMSSLQGSLAIKATTPSERWAAAASQYVGQRPIWAALRSHFLSVGVFDADKPTVLVFFGPSGYGKSEMAKRVASVLHGIPMPELETSGKMVYIHMPSFCTKDSIYSLVDPPAAHVGSGILLSALQQHPDAVVVLDEFEKSTAEAIHNLWLSAFQKNGVLRSLKEASRSVSTVRTTFILTCNIAAESITAREWSYLNASLADQERMRTLFQSQCKDVCRETMGDPFVNRVDYFFPFVPYTRAERRQFVCLLLERLLTSQAEKGRTIYATPGFVEAMVERLHTFHAATLEEAVRMQVARMAHEGWTSGVLTVERHVANSTVTVLLPAKTSELAKRAAPPAMMTSCPTAVGLNGGDSDDLVDVVGRSLLVEAWESLPGGPQSLAQWSAAIGKTVPARGTSDEEEKLSKQIVTPAPSTDWRGTSPSTETAPTTICSPPAPKSPAPPASRAPGCLHKEYEYAYIPDKRRILELEKELGTTRELLRQRDLEISSLKNKVLLLQKALSFVLLSLLSCLCLMALIVGLKLTMLFSLAIVFCLVFVLGVPLSVLLDAVRGLFHLLGPFKTGGLLLFLLVWLARASRSMVSCS